MNKGIYLLTPGHAKHHDNILSCDGIRETLSASQYIVPEPPHPLCESLIVTDGHVLSTQTALLVAGALRATRVTQDARLKEYPLHGQGSQHVEKQQQAYRRERFGSVESAREFLGLKSTADLGRTVIFVADGWGMVWGKVHLLNGETTLPCWPCSLLAFFDLEKQQLSNVAYCGPGM